MGSTGFKYTPIATIIILVTSYLISCVIPSNPKCDRVMTSGDVVSGFVWNPSDGTDGNLAVYLPSEFKVKFVHCQVEKGMKIHNLHFDKFVGNRQVWLGDMPGRRYPHKAQVICFERKSNMCRWQIKNSRDVND